MKVVGNVVGIIGVLCFAFGSIVDFDDTPWEWVPYICCAAGIFDILFWLLTAGREYRI